MRKEWKSVEHEYPVAEKQVLIRCENGCYWAGRIRSGLEWWANGWGIITTKVTHWMYIEGPEEEQI